ncbi:cysteine--tRNA ligase [Candidatus Roizmanbacteria bacterium RIFCSPLOWO2_01_FULL_38_11]|uniref:Cysteine--tRNA ligase n=1 Tax=Candidatus Roizmanbacteria bacterium RIFCSPLOWO2_01_FULL_38_11 TaxID=1802060 RepID=A0A1F7IMH4_9BACT|nr:MAG: cysteine--tRNA ligase [Candidatus Roizmanbacteria bacterium RIFCSPLOWO2_01_FULL_38_11]
MKLYNTKTKTIDTFNPLVPNKVGMYSCGPTVYDYSHIGHLRTYVYTDVLKRALLNNGYEVKHVMNITDVGHLSGDDDSGEDKMEKGVKKFGKSIDEIVKYFTDFFFASTDSVNIIRPDIICSATVHIKEMINLIKILEQKGFTYSTEEAVYFDISKLHAYGVLSKQKLDEKKLQAREEVYSDPGKKHPADFALWFKKTGRFKDHILHWSSPWEDGFPGWHIECSAMSMKYLGPTFDIHTGGVDHIPTHHENEIAQSEAATGKEFVRYWFHAEFLLVDGVKMSKSLGNLFTYKDVLEKGFNPISMRFLFLQTHYRQAMNFTWTALQSAEIALNKIYETIDQLKKQTQRAQLSEEKLSQVETFKNTFDEYMNDDLKTPSAIAILWEVIKSNIPSEDKLDLLYAFDEVLGLSLRSSHKTEISEEVIKLAEARLEARRQKDFRASDDLRKLIKEKGYDIEDTDSSYLLKKAFLRV